MGFIVFKDLEDMRFDGFSLEVFQKKRHLEKSSSIVLLLFTRLNSILSVLKFPLARCGHILERYFKLNKTFYFYYLILPFVLVLMGITLLLGLTLSLLP